VGTGSGCIALALVNLPDLDIQASDILPGIKQAEENLSR
jgi:methylase of polypeptide subunit release factors